MKHNVAVVLLATLLASSTAFADSGLNPSNQVVIGTLSIVASPVLSVIGSAKGKTDFLVMPMVGSILIVTGIHDGGGESVEVVVESAAQAGKWMLRMSGDAFRASGVAAGQALTVSAVTGGRLLVFSGKVLAFIPDTVGNALLEHSRVPS